MRFSGAVRLPRPTVAPPAAWALAVGLCLLALVVRLPDTDRFVTTDELFWVGRSGNFARALTTGQLGQTVQTGHPGVTTIWTALIGMGPSRALDLAGSRRVVSRREVSEHPSFLPGLAAARRAFGLVTALGVAVAAVLAWRLFGPVAAILGGCLLALDPFLAAHSRLVHVDATLTIWTTLAVLASLARWSGGGPTTLALAGLATGLALLSKAPAAFLVGFVPLSAILFRGRCALRERTTWRDLAIWAGLAGLTYLALFPALWVAPADTLRQVVGFVRDNANPAHAAVAEAGPGPLYYPLVFLLRSTPLTLFGLAALLIVRPSGRQARAALLLALFACLFALAMTISAKSFDRYLLPIFPALDLLAGLGLASLLERLVAPRRRPVAVAGVATALVGLSSWWLLAAWPYLLTYANPLAGGPARASASVASGWGEGLDQVAEYLSRQPDPGQLIVGMPGEIYTTVLGSQFAGQVAPAEGADAAAYDYLVVYTRNLQLGELPPFFDQRFLRWTPETTVSLGGVDYAWIYTTSGGAPVGAHFGDLLALEGYGLDATSARAGGRFELRLHWRALRPLPPGLQLVADLRPANGDGAPVSRRLPVQMGAADGHGGRLTATYPLSLDPDVRPGPYLLAVQVLDAVGRPLALTRSPLLGPEATPEPDAVVLRGIQVR